MEDETLAAKTARLGCATLVDAIGRVHSHRVHIPSMASPDPSRTLFGRAATISFMPYREDLVEPGRDFRYFFYGALGGRAPTPGQVLVLSSGGYPDVSHGGGTKLSRADGHGLAGVLADGRLRDFDQLHGYSFATWCRGEAVRWGGDTVMPHAFGIAVEISGVCEPRRLRLHGQRGGRGDPFSEPAPGLGHRGGGHSRGGRGCQKHQGRSNAAGQVAPAHPPAERPRPKGALSTPRVVWAALNVLLLDRDPGVPLPPCPSSRQGARSSLGPSCDNSCSVQMVLPVTPYPPSQDGLRNDEQAAPVLVTGLGVLQVRSHTAAV